MPNGRIYYNLRATFIKWQKKGLKNVMKIIELGNIDIRFSCPKCHTIFEVSTKELERTGPRSWSIGCPLCGELITIGDGGTINFLIKREELKNK